MIDESQKEIVEHLEEKIEVKMKIVKEKRSAQDDRISVLEKWADMSDQEMRSTNIIIRGLTSTNIQTKEELTNLVASTLSKKLVIKLLPTDIRFIMRLGKERNDKNKPLKVALHEPKSRDFLIRKRNLLKGTNIWIGEDLTLKRSKLAFLARQAAKHKECYKI